MKLDGQDSKATQAISSDQILSHSPYYDLWLATRIILLYLKRIML